MLSQTPRQIGARSNGTSGSHCLVDGMDPARVQRLHSEPAMAIRPSKRTAGGSKREGYKNRSGYLSGARPTPRNWARVRRALPGVAPDGHTACRLTAIGTAHKKRPAVSTDSLLERGEFEP